MLVKMEDCPILYLKRHLPKGCMWSAERLTKVQATSRPDHGKSRSKWRRTRMGNWTQTGQCPTTERNFFHCSKWWRISGDKEKCKEKAGPIKIEKNKNGQLRSQNSRMPEIWEAFTPLIPMTKSTRTLSKKRERNWRHQWRTQCRARDLRAHGSPGP